MLAERRAHPDPDAQDIVTAAIDWKIDGQPPSDVDLLNCMLLMFMAGQELASVMEHWHRAIPDYEVVETPTEHGGGVWGLDGLTPRW